MRKNLVYIIAAAAVLFLCIVSVINARNRPRQIDHRITLRQSDKIPYGTSAAKQLLPQLFSNARVFYNRDYATYWDSVSSYESNQAVIIMANALYADKDELERLLDFVKHGNYVFIIARSFSYDAQEFFGFSYAENTFDQLSGRQDSLRIRLEPSVFTTQSDFIYPGKKFESFFDKWDTAHTAILGRSSDGEPNFITMKAGAGSFFIHCAPLAFSNYFILHKNNVSYYNQAISVLPHQLDKIVWNEYYLTKKRGQKEPNWLGVLMRFPAFKWALLTAMLAGLLYILLGMRRRQRMIPVYTRPQNESLEFVKTMGRLYFENKDHKNLAKKMGAYFLDHVRVRYKLSTHLLDDEFIQKLQFKSGYPSDQVKYLVGFTRDLEGLPAVSEGQLLQFQKQLELFYQNT
jgi:hypothetical protein